MMQVFKPKAGAWVNSCLLNIAIAIGCALLAEYLDARGLYIFCALTLFAGLRNGFTLSRQKITVNDEAFEARNSRDFFRIRWGSIIATKFDETSEEKFLSFGAMDDARTIPLKFFDASAIWEQVKTRVKPEALAPDAEKRLPYYAEADRAQTKLINELRPTIVVRDSMFLKGVGWVCVAMFSACAFFSWRSETEVWVAFLFLGFVGLGASVLAMSGQLELDTKKAARVTRINRYEMRWDEIKRIEIDKQANGITFSNGDKRIVALGLAYWSKENASEALEFINAQIAQREIEFVETTTATMKLSKNTKIKKL
jgi:hypothetical protein